MFGSGDGLGFGGNGRLSVGDSGGFLPGNDGWSSQSGGGDGGRQSGSSGQSRACLPLKASMILQSQAANVADYRLTILGKEVEIFKLVGFVKEMLQSDSQKISFVLDDGSAFIRVEWYVNWLFDGEMTQIRQKKFNSIQPEVWVVVHGEVNMLGKIEPHVKATMIRVVEDYNEIFYHDIDVAYNIAKVIGPGNANSPNRSSVGLSNFQQNENPIGQQNQNLPFQQQHHFNNPPSMQPSYNASSLNTSFEDKNTAASKLDPASRKVYEILQMFTPQRPGGVSIHEVLTRMRGSGFPDYSEAHLRSALDLLSREGFAFFSSDMDHWKSLSPS